MLRVRDYPCRGDLYCEILSKCYLARFKYRESELLEVLGMERSTFYDRKKEAILLFGLSLWGGSIPKLRHFLVDNEENIAETVDDDRFRSDIIPMKSDKSPTVFLLKVRLVKCYPWYAGRQQRIRNIVIASCRFRYGFFSAVFQTFA